jgi:hypothetical protein
MGVQVDTAAIGLGNINAVTHTSQGVGRLNQSDSLTNRRKPVMTFPYAELQHIEYPQCKEDSGNLPKSSAGFHHSFMAGASLDVQTFGESNRDIFFHHHHCSSRRDVYDLGFSFFSFHRADRPTPETLTTLKRTPGISPLALPLRPNPARRTSSFSSTKFKQPSLGTVWC